MRISSVGTIKCCNHGFKSVERNDNMKRSSVGTNHKSEGSSEVFSSLFPHGHLHTNDTPTILIIEFNPSRVYGKYGENRCKTTLAGE